MELNIERRILDTLDGALNKQLTLEDSEALRQKIARQREEILKAKVNETEK